MHAIYSIVFLWGAYNMFKGAFEYQRESLSSVVCFLLGLLMFIVGVAQFFIAFEPLIKQIQ